MPLAHDAVAQKPSHECATQSEMSRCNRMRQTCAKQKKTTEQKTISDLGKDGIGSNSEAGIQALPAHQFI
jgi:hypothetical protein